MDRGAHFVKADLQVHTPRDPNWKLKCPDDATRTQFAREFVTACRAAGLGAVAITDHHDFAFVPFIRAAAESELDVQGDRLSARERLVVFPGLELSLAVPCQALLIFSADFPDDRLGAVLDKLGIEPAPADDLKALQPAQLPFQTFAELHDRLDETSWLRGQYIVLPNVTDGGHQTLMRSQMQSKYIDMPCVGGYLDGKVSKIGLGNRRKFDGLDPNWGNKKIGVIQTSDARTFDALGSNPTWLKWAKPTAEALRQACLAAETRISHVHPAGPSSHIARLSVSNSKFLGGFDLLLNPQYNALIGGRGTGKSSSLEYLRWALCDDPPGLVDDADQGTDLAVRRRRLIDRTLAPFDGHVDVHFVINSVPHLVRRYASSGSVKLKVGDGELADVAEDQVRALLPIDAYGQRQLSGISVRLEELRRFITSPLRERLTTLSLERAELERQIRENYVQVRRARAVAKSLAADELALASVEGQIKSLQDSLLGVTPEDRLLLDSKTAWDAGRSEANDLDQKLERARETVQAAIVGFRTLVPPAEPPSFAAGPDDRLLSALRQTARDQLVEAGKRLVEISGMLDESIAPGSPYADLRAQWGAEADAYAGRYAEAAQSSNAHQTTLRSLETLEEHRTELSDRIARQRQANEGVDPIGLHQRLLERWRSLERRRATVLEEKCSELSDLSEQSIRATLRPSTGTAEQQSRLSAAVQGSRVRGQKIEYFLEGISTAENPLVAWHDALSKLSAHIDAVADGAAVVQVEPVLSAFSGEDVVRMAAKLSSETLLDLALMPLEDQPRFEYRSKEGSYIRFQDASAGQQATALLGVLLNQEGPPLIIDQPEDDLDSQVIQDIVRKIWAAKARRQIIFASHNANLVVNGDAELVACFDYRVAGDHSAGRVKYEGAIDVPEVRDEIAHVMEGGEKAFRLRKEKYGF